MFNSKLLDFPSNPKYSILIGAIILIELVLKGLALWRSAGRKQKWWFIAILIVNSLGILPVVYLLTHPQKK